MELRIGAPLIRKGPKNLFKLVVNCLHGDAEKTTYRTIMIQPDQIQKFKDFISFLLWCNKRYPEHDEIAERMKQLEDKHNYRFSSLIDRDCTVNFYWNSIPTLERLTYFDPLGIERKVEILKSRL